VAQRRCGALPASSFALYLGNPDPCRKTVILPIEPGSDPRSIIKYAENDVAQKALEAERTALNALNASCVSQFVPKLLDHQITVAGRQLEIEYRKRRWIPQSRLQAVAIEFLKRLSTVDRTNKTLRSVLDEIQAVERCAPANPTMRGRSAIREKIENLASPEFPVCGHLNHGDFAPWNCSWTTEGFFVFDWEASTKWAPAFDDAFYYAVAPFLHIRGSMSPGKAKRLAFTNASELIKTCAIQPEEIEIYWLLWLYQLSLQKNLPNEWI
jgi:hypothetical protein